MKCPYRTKKELKITPSGIAEEEEYKDCLYDACPFYRCYLIKIEKGKNPNVVNPLISLIFSMYLILLYQKIIFLL